jgi:hypothetical protein
MYVNNKVLEIWRKGVTTQEKLFGGWQSGEKGVEDFAACLRGS